MTDSKDSKKMTENRTKTISMKDNESKCSFFLGDTECGKKALQFFDGLFFSILISLVTIVTLFSDDVRQILFPPEADLTFTILTLVCMFFYIIEMVALSLLKEGYFLKFYFWLDIISTATMILDLMWINEFINTGGSGVDAATNIAKIARASRASKIGAKSTKLIRIIRLIRILRLYKTASHRFAKEEENRLPQDKKQKNSVQNLGMQRKLSKRLERIREASRINFQTQGEMRQQISLSNILFHGSNRKLSVLNPNNPNNMRRMSHLGSFMRDKPIGLGSIQNIQPNKKNTMQEQNHEHQQQSQQYPSVKKVSIGQIGQVEYDFPAQTMVGSKLKDEIQKNIITMILLILISIPLLNLSTWQDKVNSYDKGIFQLEYFATTSQTEYDTFASIFIEQMTSLPQPMIFFSLQVNSTCCQFPTDYPSYNNLKDVEDLRTDDLYIVPTQKKSKIVFDTSSTNVLNAQLNIGRTLFVCVLLIVATLLLSNDVEAHALEPLQNMINTVKRISSDPLHALKEIQKEMMIKKSIPKNQNKQNTEAEEELIALLEENDVEKTEPAILENMIVKIGSLLAVGFGEAGTQLIARNIQNNGSLNVMIPGKKIMAIYGFCDIRNFTDATEILEAQVMVFVNQIAQICHEVVNRVGGNPNKNVGDAFLLVWKFKEEDSMVVQNANVSTLELRIGQKVKQLADLAVYSFVKIVAEITKSHTLQKYRNNPKLKERIKDYNGVKMGFGLHVGWSIEGPIGSQFKIDSSYLGANVNMSSRLEGATKQYGIPILISGDIYELMTLKNKENLRQVDRVFVKEGEKPMNLYTVDLSTQNLIKNIGINKQCDKTPYQKKRIKVHHNLMRDKLMDMIETKRVTYNLWNEDKDISVMRQPYSKFFFDEWKRAFAAYEAGKWSEAIELFKGTKLMGNNHNDGPSENLINFMNKYQGLPPLGWHGVRQFNG